jgi:hypothetical protein
MAGQSLEFTISASDQASKVVTSVQNKIDNFGKDVGKSIAGMLGPMALVGFAVSKVTEYLAEMEKKAKEAFDFGASLSDAAEKLGVTVEQFQQIKNAAAATGSSIDDVTKAYKLAEKRLDEVKNGNLDALDSFTQLGFSIADLQKITPEDYLARTANAMAQATSPTEKMAIAMAALGKDASALQKVLEKGFDIQGAFLDTEGLSAKDADTFRKSERIKRAKENRDKLDDAKKIVKDEEDFIRSEFLKTEEGKKFIKSRGKGSSKSFRLTDEGRNEIDAEIERLRLEKKRIADEKNQAGNAPKAAAGLLDKSEKDKAKEEANKIAAKEKADADKAAGRTPSEPKTPKAAKDQTQLPGEMSRAINVSSLREIGGGMAGEVAVSEEQYKQNQLELLREAVRQLEQLNKGPGDFTKARDVAPFNPTKNIA